LGDLTLQLAGGEIRLHKPLVYQEVDGVKEAIDSHYILNAKQQVGFQVAEYDANRPLVIDPVLSYSTYLGGTEFDDGQSIAVDAAGGAYLTGSTDSLVLPGFPPPDPLSITPSPFRDAPAGLIDAFVVKLRPAGSLDYATYLGGTDNDFATGIAVDANCMSSCDAYVIGETKPGDDFPRR